MDPAPTTWVIANPHARSVGECDPLCRAVEALGWRWVEPASVEALAATVHEAARAGVARLVVAGGDGTVHDLVQTLAELDEAPVLGVLPLGTGNDLVRSLGLDLDAHVALEQIVDGATRRIDLARATIEGAPPEWLINVSASGFAGEVNTRIDEGMKARWGTLAFLLGALDALSDLPTHRLELRVGDHVERLESVAVMVANARTCGGGLLVAPTADLEDGLLDVTVVTANSPGELAGVGVALRSGQLLSNAHVRHFVGADVELRADPPMQLNLDGELRGPVARARYAIARKALTVHVGPDYAREPALR